MNYYRRHVGDYLKDTAHLSLLEHGVYTRLLDVYYTREAPFAPGEAARLVGARTKEERAAVDAVLAEFFVDGRQGRCDREIEKYQAKAAQNREVGSLGGRPRKSETQSDPKAEPKNNPDGFRKEPIPNSQEPIAKKEKENPPAVAGPPTKGYRLPQDWCPDDAAMAVASKLGLGNGTLAQEIERFRDHFAAAPGQKGIKLDWNATWRNWCRRAAEMRGAPPVEAYRGKTL